jgi:hypothetical protein
MNRPRCLRSRINRPACGKAFPKCRGSFRFDRDKPDAVLEPGSDTANQAAASDGNEQRVEILHVLFDFVS